MTDTERAVEVLKSDIISLIVTFESNFNEQVNVIAYDCWHKPEEQPNKHEIRIDIKG